MNANSFGSLALVFAAFLVFCTPLLLASHPNQSQPRGSTVGATADRNAHWESPRSFSPNAVCHHSKLTGEPLFFNQDRDILRQPPNTSLANVDSEVFPLGSPHLM